jgi:hypothetical protein
MPGGFRPGSRCPASYIRAAWPTPADSTFVSSLTVGVGLASLNARNWPMLRKRGGFVKVRWPLAQHRPLLPPQWVHRRFLSREEAEAYRCYPVRWPRLHHFIMEAAPVLRERRLQLQRQHRECQRCQGGPAALGGGPKTRFTGGAGALDSGPSARRLTELR